MVASVLSLASDTKTSVNRWDLKDQTQFPQWELDTLRAIRQVAPMAVDVSGGVEKAPGEKDFDKMVRFLEAVKSADNYLPKVD